MPDKTSPSELDSVPEARDPDYSAFVPGSEHPDAIPGTRPTAPEPAAGTSLADTSGTGTIVALGCIGATLFLIVIGLLYLGITQVFG